MDTDLSIVSNKRKRDSEMELPDAQQDPNNMNDPTGAAVDLSPDMPGGKAKAKAVDPPAESTFPEPLQNLLGWVLDALVMDEPHRVPGIAKAKARKIKGGAHTMVAPLFIGFDDVRLQLAAALYNNIQDMYQDIETHCLACFAAMEDANATNPALDARIRQFLVDAQQQYAQEVISLCEEVAETRLGRSARRLDSEGGRARRARAPVDDGMPPLPGAGLLPDCIRNNYEPYYQLPWRKEPYPPRSYRTLTKYELRATCEEEAELLKWKLTTRRQDGASEHFRQEHAITLGDRLRDTELALARAVQVRATLQMGVDVREVDTWGVDMYTRRNCFDAIWEAGVFSHLRSDFVAPTIKTPDRVAGAGDVAVDVDMGVKEEPSGSQMEAHQPLDLCSPVVKARLAADNRVVMGMGAALGSKITAEDEADADADTIMGEVDGVKQDQAEAKVKVESEGVKESAVEPVEGALTSVPAAAAVMGPRAVAPYPILIPVNPETLAIHKWIDRNLLSAANATGTQGFNMLTVCEVARERARAQDPDLLGITAADAVAARLTCTGWNYFRLHPKGRGIECARPGGLPGYTFIEEYLGELYTASRWWEIQDAVKKVTGEDDLPEFYNITLERPRDDPEGLDVLYIEAAFMATFASRMSHSCTPNCSAVVLSAGGKLTIAMYTLRHIQEGEELTFDYNCVTESEKEFKSAVCLCGTAHCRGSYLLLMGAKAFSVALEAHHNLLHRQALLLRACHEPLTDDDTTRLAAHGVGPIALGNGLPGNPVAPTWLQKWASLALEFVELERGVLPTTLLALPPPFNTYTKEYAEAQALGVMSSRVNSILVTLDMCKLYLRQPGQTQAPPVRLMTDQEVLTQLWSGDKSLIRRTLMSATPFIPCPEQPGGMPLLLGSPEGSCSRAELQRVLDLLGGARARWPLAAMLVVALREPTTVADARSGLLELSAMLRVLEDGSNGCHMAAADVLLLSAWTQTWFTAERHYKGFNSKPVELHDDLLKLHKSMAAQMASGTSLFGGARSHAATAPLALEAAPAAAPGAAPAGQVAPGAQTSTTPDLPAAPPPPTSTVAASSTMGGAPAVTGVASSTGAVPPELSGAGPPEVAAGVPPATGAAAGVLAAEGVAVKAEVAPSSEVVLVREHPPPPRAKSELRSKLIDPNLLSKRYAPMFLWGQLNCWFKQTSDPVAGLTLERRGPLSLPDIESCYNTAKGQRYTAKDRAALLDHIEKKPEAQWKLGSPGIFTFRNDNRMYGTPMFDAIYLPTVGKPSQMVTVLQHLRAAAWPWAAAGK